MRDKPGRFGFVGANGGIMSKYSVGIYSTEPVAWKADRSAALQADRRLPRWPVAAAADGPATIETYSVRYDWPTTTGIIVGRLDSDDSRFLATSEDEDFVALLSGDDPLGAPIVVRRPNTAIALP